MQPRRVGVYVDKFNLYYGLFRFPGARPASEKWLNIVELAELICAQRGAAGSVSIVRYCTFEVLPSGDDPDQPIRQRQLLNALASLPQVDITLGLFKERTRTAKLFGPKGSIQKPSIQVSQREEKGSDVNLATFLVRDAALNEVDLAMVISNDSDLKNAFQIARTDFGKEIWVVTPHFRNRKANVELQRVADRYFWLDVALLAQSQFPHEVCGPDGHIVARCPKEWL
jgi:uncharacterized LabA/DUF88 family protein